MHVPSVYIGTCEKMKRAHDGDDHETKRVCGVVVVAPISTITMGELWTHEVFKHLSLVDVYCLSLVDKERRQLVTDAVRTLLRKETMRYNWTLTRNIMLVLGRSMPGMKRNWVHDIQFGLTLARLHDLPSYFFDDLGTGWKGYHSKIIGDVLAACSSDDEADAMIDGLQDHWLPLNDALNAVLYSGRVGVARRRLLWKRLLGMDGLHPAIKSKSLPMVEWVLERYPWHGYVYDDHTRYVIKALHASDDIARCLLPPLLMDADTDAYVRSCARDRAALDRLMRLADADALLRIKRLLAPATIDINAAVVQA